MNTTGKPPRGQLDRVIDRIGCFIAVLPVGAAVLLAVSQVFNVPMAWLLLALVVFATWGGATPAARPKARDRRPSLYERTRRVVRDFEDGQITEAERDKRLKELSHD